MTDDQYGATAWESHAVAPLSPGPRWALRLRCAVAVVVLLPLTALPWAGRSTPRWALVGAAGLLLLSCCLAGPRATGSALWSAVRWLLPDRSQTLADGGRPHRVLRGASAALDGDDSPSPGPDSLVLGKVTQAVPADRSDVVKRAGRDELVERVTDRWEEGARWAKLSHPNDAAVIAPAVGPASRNGVGGVVLLVDPDPARKSTGDFDRAAGKLARTWQVEPEHVFVRRAGRLVELHVYDGQPLAEPIGPGWLEGHPVEGERVPVGPTATGEAAVLPLRLSVMHTSATDGGKTNVQLAYEVSLALSGVPSQLIVLDNKSAPGGRGSELLPVHSGALFYRSRTDQAWDCIRCAQAIMRQRLEDVGGREYLPIDGYNPVTTLLLGEGLDVLKSRPPDLPVEVLPGGTKAAALAREWVRYTDGQLEQKPTGEQWQAFLRDRVGEIVRLGRLVNVRVSWAGQLGQVALMSTALRSVFPCRWAGRLPGSADVEPALGVPHQQAPAHRIPSWQKGAGYLAFTDAVPEFHRPVLVDDATTGGLLVPHLQRWLPDRPPRLHVVGGYPS